MDQNSSSVEEDTVGGNAPFADDEHDLTRYLHFRHVRPSHNRTEVVISNRLQRQNRSWPRTLLEADAAQGDAFCACYKDKPRVTNCNCGEVGKVLEWVWDVETKSNCTHLVNNNKDVRFHLHYSGGTAVIRGSLPMVANQHYWEVKMTSLVYGTDMMVGVGTKDADIHRLSDKFCSVLGIDCETWGLSYTGLFHHKGKSRGYAPPFGQGSIIGVHLDMWNGTLSFYKNRRPLGIACSGLKGKTLYAMVSSTAARSGMRIIHSCSFPSSLQFLCCVALRKSISLERSVLDALSLPPGLQTFLTNNLGWLLGEEQTEISSVQPSGSRTKRSETFKALHSSEAKRCQHEHLTCVDCNSSVFTKATNSSLEGTSRDFVLLSPSVVLENINRFQTTRPPRREKSESDPSEEDFSGSEMKKRKFSYNYAIGLSDDDSDNTLSDHDGK